VEIQKWVNNLNTTTQFTRPDVLVRAYEKLSLTQRDKPRN